MKTLLPYLHKLDHEFPKEVRLEVYKKAIEIIAGGLWNSRIMHSDQLCLLLPTITWDLTSYISRPTIDGDSYFWLHNHSQIAFPEITNGFIATVNNMVGHSSKNQYRLEKLNSWVAQLENEIK